MCVHSSSIQANSSGKIVSQDSKSEEEMHHMDLAVCKNSENDASVAAQKYARDM